MGYLQGWQREAKEFMEGRQEVQHAGDDANAVQGDVEFRKGVLRWGRK